MMFLLIIAQYVIMMYAKNAWKKLVSDEQKYPILDDETKESDSIKKVKINCHKHPLMYCITSRNSLSKTSWI